MPFDGHAFSLSAVSAPAPARPGLWARLRSFVRTVTGTPFDSAVLFEPSPVYAPCDARTVELLQAARAIIADESAWTRGAYQTLDRRNCAVGALRRAARRLDAQPAYRGAHRHLRSIARARGFESVETMNDRSTHAQVLDAFDLAIVAARRG